VNYPDSLLNTGNGCGFPTSFSGTVFSRTISTPTYPASSYTGSLAAFAGQEIKLRWRLGTDSTGTGKGWWVDDVAVTDAVFRAACASGSSANPKEAGPESAPMTADRANSGTAVNLAYGPGCGTTDNAVYWGTGPIVGAATWSGVSCSIGNTGQASFDPGDPLPGDFLYFVIVGQNAAKEGSYGAAFIGGAPLERGESSGFGACDKPQDLSGSCP
jgi:hypothetical protein